jgi:Leucine-rich repeat (LRR) protein
VDTFRNLSGLIELDLSFNQLETIHVGTFSHLTSLRTLRMQWSFTIYGQLRDMSPLVFNGLVALTTLEFTMRYRFQPSMHMLNGLRQLQNVTLQEIGMEGELRAPLFSGLSNLTTVDLSKNRVSAIHAHTFINELTNLLSLDLSFNQLISLHVDTFSALTNLKRLNLGQNQWRGSGFDG